MNIQEYRGGPFGSQTSCVGTTPVAIDLTSYAWHKVLIWSQDQNLRVAFALPGTDPTTMAAEGTDQAVGNGAIIAFNIAKGYAVPFVILSEYPLLIVATDAGTGTVKIKPVGKVEPV